MKDLETLLSLIAGLTYLMVSATRKHKANPPPEPDWEEAIWPEPAVHDKQTADTAQQREVSIPRPRLVKDTLPPTRSYRITDSAVPSSTYLPNSTKLNQPPPSAQAHGLERILGRYSSLKKAIIMSELLQPKTYRS